MRILDDKQTRRMDLEEQIAIAFKNSSSLESRKLRKDFEKVNITESVTVQFVDRFERGCRENYTYPSPCITLLHSHAFNSHVENAI
jgi:hypothetical protein